MKAADASLDLHTRWNDDRTQHTAPPAPTRGIGWVLQWAAALATLLFAAAVLTEFGYCLAAEHALHRAARAAVLEATLPRATTQTVAATAERCIAKWRPDRMQFSFQQCGTPVRSPFRPRAGDRLCVTLALPADSVLPAWVCKLRFWRGGSLIQAHAERSVPGRPVSTAHAS